MVIGRPCRNVTRDQALDYVLRYTCGNHVSARDWQLQWGGGQWCRGRTFATCCPLGPALVTPEDIPDPNALGIKTVINGETRDHTGLDYPRHDLRRAGVDRLPERQHHAGARDGDNDRHPRTVWERPASRRGSCSRGDSVTIEIELIGALTHPVVEES